MFVDSLSRSDLHQKDIREKLPPQLWPFLSKYCLKIWPLKVKCNMYKLVSFERLKKKLIDLQQHLPIQNVKIIKDKCYILVLISTLKIQF